MDGTNTEDMIPEEFHYTGRNGSSVIKGLSIKDGVLILRSLPPADFFTSPEKYILETDPETNQPSIESRKSLEDYRRLFAQVRELHIEGHNTKRGKKLSAAESDDTSFVFTPELAKAMRDALGGGFTRIEINNSNVMLKGNGVERLMIADILTDEEKAEAAKRLPELREEIRNAEKNLETIRNSGTVSDETFRDETAEAVRLRIKGLKEREKFLERSLNLGCDAFEMILKQDSPQALDDSGRIRFAFADLDIPMVLKVEAKDGLREERSQNIIRPGFMAGSRILSVIAPDANMSVGPAAFSQISNTATALSRIKEYENGVIELSELTEDMEKFTKEFRKTFDYTQKEKEASERFVRAEMVRDYGSLDEKKNLYELNETDYQTIIEKTQEKEKINPSDDYMKSFFGYEFLSTQMKRIEEYDEARMTAYEAIGNIAGPEHKAGDTISANDVKALNGIINAGMMKRYEYLSTMLEENFRLILDETEMPEGFPKTMFETPGSFYGESRIGEMLIEMSSREKEKEREKGSKEACLKYLRKKGVPNDPLVREWLRLYRIYRESVSRKKPREEVFSLEADCFASNADLHSPSELFHAKEISAKLGEEKYRALADGFLTPAKQILSGSNWKENLERHKSKSREERENEFIWDNRLTSGGLKGTGRSRLTYFEPNAIYDRIVAANMDIIKIREEKQYYSQNHPELSDKWKENIMKSQELRERMINQTDGFAEGSFRPLVGITGTVNRENLVMAGLDSNRIGTLSFNHGKAMKRLYAGRYEALKTLTFTMKDFREKEEKRIKETNEKFKKRIDDLTWVKLDLERKRELQESLSEGDEKRLEAVNSELAGINEVVKRNQQVYSGLCDIYSSLLGAWEDHSHSIRMDDDSFIPSEEHYVLLDDIEKRVTESIRSFIETDRKRIFPAGTDVPEETKESVSAMLGGVSGFQWNWKDNGIIQFEKMRLEQEEILANGGVQLLEERSGNYKGIAAEFNAKGIDGASYDSRRWTDEFIMKTGFHSANRSRYREFLSAVDRELPQSNRMLVRLQELNAQELRDLMARNADYLNSELDGICGEIEKLNEKQSEADRRINQLQTEFYNSKDKGKKYPQAEINYQNRIKDSVDRERKALMGREKQLRELVARIEPQLVYHETEEGRFTRFDLDTEAYFRAERFLHDNKTVENYIINHSARGQELKRKIKEFEKQYGTLNERTGQYEIVPGVSPLFTDKNNEEALEEYRKVTGEFSEFMRRGMPTSLSDLADGGSENTCSVTVGDNVERTVAYAMNNEKMKYEGLDVREDGKIQDVTVTDLIAERLSKANRHYIRVGKLKDGIKDVGKTLIGNVHYYSATQAVTLGILLMIACSVKAISAGGKIIAHANQESRLRKYSALLWIREEIEKNRSGKAATAFFDNTGDTLSVQIGDFSVRNSEYEKMFTDNGKVTVSRKELDRLMNDHEAFSRIFSRYARDRKETDERRNMKIRRAEADAKKYAKDFSQTLDSVKTIPRPHRPNGKTRH